MSERNRRVPTRAVGVLLALAGLALPVAGLWMPGLGFAQARLRTDLPDATAHLPELSVEDAVVVEGHDGTRTLSFTLRLSGPAADPVVVDVATADSTARTSDGDYEATALQISFAPGSVAESLLVVVNGDTRPETDEVFSLRLSATGAAFADSEAVGRILNDDLPLLGIEDAAVTEGDGGTRDLWFRLHLSTPADFPVSVDILTADSTATVANADYAAVSRRLTFPPGATLDSVAVPVTGDVVAEEDEVLAVRLSGVAGAVFADSEAIGTVANDDLPVISVADTSADEGDTGSRALAFRVRLTPAWHTPVSFRYKLSDGTATVADRDYEAVEGDTVFAPGEDLVLIEVPVFGDSLLEANERFRLLVSDVEGATPAELAAIGTIRNDERTSFARLATSVRMLHPGTLPPAWGDLEGDGRPDLLMYGNTGDGFTEMPGVRSQLGDGNYHGGAWCDYDRDGDMDLVLVPYPNNESSYNFTHLFENTPNGLQEVAPELGMDIVGFGETPSWGDFDADGWPDLFLPFYSHVAPFRSFLYMNLGDGRFREVADSAGISLPNIPVQLRPEGVGVADWNGDGTLDVYCASHLLLNDGDARFTDVRAQVGLPLRFDEGAQFVDPDDDGDLDLYMRTAQGPALYRNDGGMFTDATGSLGIGTLGWEWGDRWADFDADGDLDLLFFPPGAVARLMLNRGDGTFREDSSFIGVFSGSSLAAFADLDSDGDIDIAVGANGRQFALNLLEHVPRAQPAFLKVRVEDKDGFLTAHGATVRLRSLDDPRQPVQTRIVDGGSGYLGQDEYTITFGGVGSGTFALEVSYPSKPGSPRVVGPAQSPQLGALRPGVTGPQLIVIRPDGEVSLQSVTATAGVPDVGPAPSSRMWPASPNPTRIATRFALSLPSGGDYSLTVHDLSGRKVRTLVRRGQGAGGASVEWDLRDDAGRDVPAGLYFARLQRGRERAGVQRVVVLR